MNFKEHYATREEFIEAVMSLSTDAYDRLRLIKQRSENSSFGDTYSRSIHDLLLRKKGFIEVTDAPGFYHVGITNLGKEACNEVEG